MQNKSDLLQAMQDLLQKSQVRTQEEISVALKAQGFKVNQVKISRLLNKLGAIKLNEGDQTVYRLPTELVSVRPNDTLKYLILNITHNETLVVIQTAPGSAQLVARLLDQRKHTDVLGTVAGDDTIFVAPVTIKKIKSLYDSIRAALC